MKKIFNIDGMSCNHCVLSVEKALIKLKPNHLKVEIGSAEVEFDENKITEQEIIDSIESEGYKVQNLR